jgi:hypothetical protein
MADDQNNIPQGARDQAALAAFVEQMITDKKDPAVNGENMSRLSEVLLGELNDQINTHLINLLPEDKQKELEGLLDKEANDMAIDGFFEKNIVNLEAEIAAVLLNFRAGYLAVPVKNTEPPKNIELPVDQSANSLKTTDDLWAAPPAPADHTPFDTATITADKVQTTEKSWN